MTLSSPTVTSISYRFGESGDQSFGEGTTNENSLFVLTFCCAPAPLPRGLTEIVAAELDRLASTPREEPEGVVGGRV